MTWGFLTVTHIVSLIFAVAMIVGLYFILKGRTERTKTIVLGILSFSGLAAIIYNLLVWNSPLEYLPFHLCSLSAMVLPFAVFTKNKVLNNLLLLWSFGSLFALLINVSVAEASIFSWVFFFFYFPHVLECGIPILMFALKMTKKDLKCIGSTLGITLGAYTVVHFINLFVNDYAIKHNVLDWKSEVISVNYMYSIRPENPLLDLFSSIIPHSYWYMYLTMIMAAVYLGLVYLPEIIALVRKKRGGPTA